MESVRHEVDLETDVRLSYLEAGSGPPLLIIPGLGGSATKFVNQVEIAEAIAAVRALSRVDTDVEVRAFTSALISPEADEQTCDHFTQETLKLPRAAHASLLRGRRRERIATDRNRMTPTRRPDSADRARTTSQCGDTEGMSILPALLLDRSGGSNHTETAYYTIKRRIIELKLAPGGLFTEAELAREWGTSKTPVREALARLQQDGLVESVPRSGYSVRPITLRSTEALCEFRSIVEPKAAEFAARNGVSPADLKRLSKLARSELARSFTDARNSVDSYLRAHFEFQALIANASGNDRLAASIAGVLDDLERVLRLVLTTLPWAESRVAERVAVVTALEQRDPPAAFAAMLARTQSSRKDILGALMATSSINDASIALPR